MRALQLVEDRRLETVDLPPPPPPAHGEVTLRIKAVALNHIDVWGWRGMAFAKRKMPLVIGAEASGEVDAVGPGVAGLDARPACFDLWRAHLRAVPGLPREARQSLRKRRRRAWLPPRRLRPGEDQHSGAAAGARPARRRCDRRGGRAGHLRHGRAHAVRQCEAGARRDDPGPCRRLRHRLRGDPARQAHRLHGDHHGRLGRQDRQGQGARRRPCHQLPRGPLRRRDAQAHQEEGRRRRVRACRRGHLGRLDAVVEARRPARHLRLDVGRLDADEPDAAVPAAIAADRLVRLPHGEHGQRVAEDGRGPGRRRWSTPRSASTTSARRWSAWKAATFSARSSSGWPDLAMRSDRQTPGWP